jgi:hypothetical protein
VLNGFTNMTITKDLTGSIMDSLKDLAKKTICVGVPSEEDTQRDNISNAELVYIHTNGVRDNSMIREMQHDVDKMPYSQAHELYVHSNGSPLWHIPPRPIIEPAIENSKEQIALLMKDTVKVALDGGDITPALNEIGMQGENIVHSWFDNPSNNWEPNSKVTIEGSKKGKNGKKFIKGKGSDRPLVDTGRLKRSITYVIKDCDV